MLELSLFVNGIVLGLVYAAVALGFSLVLGVSGVINFAHGITFTFGAYFYWVLYQKIGWLPAMFVAPLGVAVIGLLVERLVVRRVYGQDPLFGLLITLGFAMAMEELIRIIFGPATYSIVAPAFVNSPLIIGNFLFPKYRIFIAAIAALMIAAVWLFEEKSKYGAVVKAGMFNSEMVGALGHNLFRMRVFIMVLGSAIGGLAGILAAPMWSVKPSMGHLILMPSFIITLMGGLGSIPGTLVGGLLVGVCLSMGTLVVGRFVDIIPFILMAVIIYFWPRGLMGQQNILE
ncbi:MAG: branched-chain amino acid ABC transporter permease [Candidatus Adiutrix sp.]|jgi:branched-chain amino acid transport system permease protein|nr:branched-chain amino acid ABC transporter permease [Candidatus Adiutrix sp.]